MNKVFEKIIEKLEIERTIANNTFMNYEMNVDLGRVFGLERAIKIVKEVAEEYNGGWIACSERLPKYGEVVMRSCTNSGITISCITHKGVKPSKSVRFGQHSVIAWQPLPEPFKERD